MALKAQRELTLEAKRATGPGQARIALRPERVQVVAEQLEATSQNAQFTTDELCPGPARSRAANRTDLLKQSVGVLETQAQRIVETAKNVYRDAEELAQTRAGRLRLVAGEAVPRRQLHLAPGGRRPETQGRKDLPRLIDS